MASVFTATTDLLKHYVISHEWASDKITNNLVNGVILACIANISNVAFWKIFYYKFILFSHMIPCFSRICKFFLCKRKQKEIYSKYAVPKEMIEQIQALQLEKHTIKATWYTSDKKFSEAIANFIFDNYSWKYSKAVFFDMEKETTFDDNFQAWASFASLPHEIDYWFPIFMKNGEIVSITRNAGIGFFLIATSKEFLQVFIQFLKENYYKKIDIVNPEKPILKQYKIRTPFDNRSETFLHKDRNIDQLVTRHKPILIRYLEDFLVAQNGKSVFNGHGTYNFGLMLYGPPGTGKTSIAKAIANYVKRNILMINLREVKSMNTFRACFSDYPEHAYIYVFEEFDFVQGLFEESSQSSEKEAHKARILALLGSIHKDLDAESRKSIQEQIAKEEKRITELEDAITLDNLLIFLDGLQEVRGRIIIATTNHIDKINPALLREGRFDLKLKLDLFSHEETVELLTQMFPNESEKLKLATFPHEKFSCAEIISICHKYRNLDAVIEELRVKEKTC